MTVLVVVFFAITAFFHLANVSILASVYLAGLETCSTPTRWCEYTITATLMSTIIAYLSGLRGDASLVAVAGLIASTMLFGALRGAPFHSCRCEEMPLTALRRLPLEEAHLFTAAGVKRRRSQP